MLPACGARKASEARTQGAVNNYVGDRRNSVPHPAIDCMPEGALAYVLAAQENQAP
jgi:hypothetical protein